MAFDVREFRKRSAKKLGRLLSAIDSDDRVGEMNRCIELLEGAGCSFSFFKAFSSMTPIESAEYVFIRHADVI